MSYILVLDREVPILYFWGLPSSTPGSSPLLSAPTASRLLWGHSCRFTTKPCCVCLLTHSMAQPRPLITGCLCTYEEGKSGEPLH